MAFNIFLFPHQSLVSQDQWSLTGPEGQRYSVCLQLHQRSGP